MNNNILKILKRIDLVEKYLSYEDIAKSRRELKQIKKDLKKLSLSEK